MKKISVAVISVLLMAVIVLSGCAQAAKTGDKVQVNYTGKFENGTVFDSSAGRDPLEFTLGTGKVIPGFEKAVLGMKTGEKKTVTIPAAEAYGPHLDELVIELSRSQLPPEITPEVGMKLESPQDDGTTIVAMITSVTSTTITLDANHPLAGRTLTFDIELLKIL